MKLDVRYLLLILVILVIIGLYFLNDIGQHRAAGIKDGVQKHNTSDYVTALTGTLNDNGDYSAGYVIGYEKYVKCIEGRDG
jgi:hypothetical protein